MQYINKKNEMSKKIGILLVESLPLPPVKGGAVENLTQLIIDNNEDRHDLDIYVFSKYDGAAAAEAKQYHNTQYKYCNPSGIYVLIDILLKVVRRICRNYLHINTPSLYEIKAYRYFKQQGIKTFLKTVLHTLYIKIASLSLNLFSICITIISMHQAK